MQFFLRFVFSKLFSNFPISSTLFSNPNVFFQNYYRASAWPSVLPLVNVVPWVILDLKTHVPLSDIFDPGQTPLQRPVVGGGGGGSGGQGTRVVWQFILTLTILEVVGVEVVGRVPGW